MTSATHETKPSGQHTFVWAGRDDAGQACSSGIYLARVRVQTPDGATERSARVLIAR